MAIDSIESQRRLLDEQRSRELARIEKERKNEIARMEDERTRELKKIAESQHEEVKSRQSDADVTIARAQAAADNRILDYEKQVSRMTDEAKRQFQQKAALLQKNAEEIEQQRGHLIQQHTQNLKAIEQQHNSKVTEDKLKLERQANQSYMNQLRNVKDIEEKGKLEQALLNDEIRQQKQSARIEGQREIERLKGELQLQSGDAQSEIERNRNASIEQMNHIRNSQEAQQRILEEKYEDMISDLRREKSREVNQQHIQGKKQTQSVAEFYENETDVVRRDATKKMHDLQKRSEANLNAMDQDAKMQEYLAKRAYDYLKEQRRVNREKNITDYTNENEKIRDNLKTNYEKQSHELIKQKNAQLVGQTEQFKKELAGQREFSQKQVNDLKLANAKKLASHEARQSDSFYHVHSVSPQVMDTEKELLVRISVPEHEQDHIRLTEQTNQITISGNRRSENTAKTEDGRRVSTNSYQSFSETHPVTGKLNLKQMVRSYDNGVLLFRIPKV